MRTQLSIHDYSHVLYSHINNIKIGSLTNLRLNLCWLFSFHSLQIYWRFNSIWTLVATANKMTVIKMMQNIAREIHFSSPEPKAQVNFINKKISAVCRCKLFTVSSFFSKTTEPISTKLGTKQHWVKRIAICSNEGTCLLKRGDN